ncbi:MAG: hypothetical protein ABSE46_10705 [Terracidiphilus sp.]|jgi:hypothetical protein
MAHLSLRGKTVVESAGPAWHLVGSVKLDKLKPNRLTLFRRPDYLSSRIKNLGKSTLPAVQLTDLSGRSFLLANAQLLKSPVRNLTTQGGKYHPSLSGESSEHDTSELENYSFVFQAISFGNTQSSTSTSDDWNQGNK